MRGLTAADAGSQSLDYIRGTEEGERGEPHTVHVYIDREIPVRESACARESSRRSVEPVMGGQRSARRQR